MSSQKEPINFIKNINTRGYSNEKFKLTRLRMEFVLDRLDRVSDPDVVLKECIQQCIDETCSESKKQDMEVDRIGVSISSNLLDYDICICPYKEDDRKHYRCNTKFIFKSFSK